MNKLPGTSDMTFPLRAVFMGSDAFSLSILRGLCTHHQDILSFCAVYTAPEAKRGRGHLLQKTAVHLYGEEQGLCVYTPASLRGAESYEDYSRLNPDIVIVASYGFILPKKFLDFPAWGCINVHPSLLPRWRGASPVASTLLAGDAQTGISIMKMDTGMDTGPLLGQCILPLPDGMTSGALLAFLADRTPPLLADLIRAYVEGRIHPVMQSLEGVTYSQKFHKNDAYLSWKDPASSLDRKVRAMNPHPGAWVMIDNKRLQVLSSTVRPCEGALPAGTLVMRGNALEMICQDGHAFCPLTVKPEGKNEMTIEQFLHGRPCLDCVAPCPL